MKTAVPNQKPVEPPRLHTTQDINRCQTTARAGALIYNLWSWYCRAAHLSARMEAVTSRPMLLAAAGEAAQHGGPSQLYLTPLRGKVQTIKTLIVNIRATLQYVKSIAEQLPNGDQWATLLRYICQRFAPTITTRGSKPPLRGRGNCRILVYCFLPGWRHSRPVKKHVDNEVKVGHCAVIPFERGKTAVKISSLGYTEAKKTVVSVPCAQPATKFIVKRELSPRFFTSQNTLFGINHDSHYASRRF